MALAVPTTYMNESGLAVRGLAKRFGIDEPGVHRVVHDELDLPPGTVRLKAGGGLAGHNGLRSVAVAPALHRLPPGAHRRRQAAERGPGRRPRAAPAARRRSASSWPPSVETAADAVERIAADGIDAAMLWCHSLPT